MKIDRTMDEEALEAVISVLPLVGVEARRGQGRSPDVELCWEGHRVRVEIKGGSQVTGAKAFELTTRVSARPSHRVLLVADRITADARTTLTEAGWSWLDRRGWLHLRAPGMLVDREVPAATGVKSVPATPVRGRAGLAVAYWLCEHPGAVLSPTKSGLGLAPSTVSAALTELREAGLVDSQRRGVFPELFWELAAAWRPHWTWLASEPSPQDAWDAEHGTTWVRTDDRAAQRSGAPVFTVGDGPLALLVPGPVAITIASRRYGIAREGTGGAMVAVAPVSGVFASQEVEILDGWRIAPRMALALQLASTGARGREVLADWSDGVWN